MKNKYNYKSKNNINSDFYYIIFYLQKVFT